MTRPANPRPSGPPAVAPARDALGMSDRVLFCVLLALLCARPMLSETFEHIELSFLNTISTTAGPTPATTAGLDTVTLAAAGLVLARGGRWRQNRTLAAGIVLLAAAVLITGLTAADRHLARFAGASLVIVVLAGAALASLLQRRWMLHLLVAGLLATGCTTAVRCILQRTWERAATIEEWEQKQRPALLREGFDPDDPLIVNFERRMRSPEVDGFLAHPNVTGSCLMMAVLAMAGLLAASVCRPQAMGGAASVCGAHLEIDPRWIAWPLAAALCVLLFVGLWFTGSRGAQAAGAVGLLCLIVFGLAASRSAGRSIVPFRAGTWLAVLAAVYLAVISGAAIYGVRHGTLPHPSLAFRWHYWTTAIRAYEDAPLTGLGRDNFGPAYMRYKPAESTEEVRDPHNAWLSLLVELGPLGLAGGVVLSAACVLAGLRRLSERSRLAGAPSDTAPPREGSPKPGTARSLIFHAIPIAAGVLLIQMLLSGLPFAQPPVTTAIWAVEIGLVWLAAFALGLWLLWLSTSAGVGETFLAAGLLAAVLAVLTIERHRRLRRITLQLLDEGEEAALQTLGLGP